MAEDALDVTEDGFLDGRLRLRQPRTGYRAGADAILLAAAADPPADGTVFEPCCGVGAAALALAWRRADVRVEGLELDAETAALGAANAAANALADRVRIRQGDALAERGGPFDAIILNPPYAQETGAPVPADPRRRLAFVAPHDIDAWVRACVDQLTGDAALTVIHRADAAPAILRALEGRLGGIELAPIFPRTGAPAHRVLVRARKGARAAMRIWSGLALHAAEGGGFAPEAEAIFRGRAVFVWR